MSIAWKVSKYGIFPGPCFPVFSLNTGKYGPEKTPYLDTFHAVELKHVFELKDFGVILDVDLKFDEHFSSKI